MFQLNRDLGFLSHAEGLVSITIDLDQSLTNAMLGDDTNYLRKTRLVPFSLSPQIASTKREDNETDDARKIKSFVDTIPTKPETYLDYAKLQKANFVYSKGILQVLFIPLHNNGIHYYSLTRLLFVICSINNIGWKFFLENYLDVLIKSCISSDLQTRPRAGALLVTMITEPSHAYI